MPMLGSRAIRDIWWFFLVVLVADGVLAAFNVVHTAEDERKTAQSLEALSQINSLTATVYEGLFLARNFLFSGDERFAESFEATVVKTDRLIESIRRLTVENPEQAENLARAGAAIDARQVGLREKIGLRRQVKEFDQARMMPALIDRKLSEEVRDSLARLAEDESNLLRQRRKSAREAINTSVMTTVVGSLATIGVLGLLYYLINRDSQMRRQNEEVLKQANLRTAAARREVADALALLDTFFLNAPIGLAFFDGELRLLRINRYLAQYSPNPPERYLNRTATDLISHFPGVTFDDLCRVVNSGAAVVDRVSGEIQASSVNDGQVWQSDYYPVRGEGGDLLGVGAVVRDITRQLLSEQELRQSESRFRILAETLPQIVWVVRPDGFHEYYNRRWYTFTGEAVESTLGAVGWFGRAHPDDRPAAERAWREAMLANEPFEAECRLQGIGGEYRWFLCRALPIRDESGRVARWFGTCTDVNDQRRAQAELEDRVRERTLELQQVVASLGEEVEERARNVKQLKLISRELARSNRELEQFAYVASHDLQEPLRKIQAFGDRLRSRYRDTLAPQAAEYLDRMHAAAERMRRLIEDLLGFSRLTTRSAPFQSVDFNVLVAEVLGDLEERISQTSARIEIGSLPTIQGDPVQLRQLVQNLLANALKFHKPDQVPAVRVRSERIELPSGAPEAAPDVPGYRIEFQDDGIGFDMAYADRIFQVFQRLHGRDAYEGTGIGLAVCRKIAESHGGTIVAKSEPGQGASFVVTLPERQVARVNAE